MSPNVADEVQRVSIDVPRTIRMLMSGRGWTQRDLGFAAGITKSSMAHKLAGRSRFTDVELAAIAVALEVPIEVLFRAPRQALGLGDASTIWYSDLRAA